MAIHTDLDVYKNAYRLALEVHNFSIKLPSLLQYDLADQLRRASRSIPSNISEGYSRSLSKPDLQHYLKLALGSNEEVLFNIKFLYDLKLISMNDYERLTDNYNIVGKQLKALIRSLNKTTRKPDNQTTI